MNDQPAITTAMARGAGKKRPRVFETVREDIRHQVAKGFLRPGDKLPAERDLAERLGVSRAAVREALRSLEASGVLEFRNGVRGGAFIREPSASGIRSSVADMLALGKISLEHLSETRSALLELAVRLACERGTEQDFTDLKANVAETDRLRRAGDIDATIDEIGEFYVLIGNASHNGVLRALIEAVAEVFHELLVKIHPPTIEQPFIDARYEIVGKIRARETGEALRLVAEHMSGLHNFHAINGGANFLAQGRNDTAKRRPRASSK